LARTLDNVQSGDRRVKTILKQIRSFQSRFDAKQGRTFIPNKFNDKALPDPVGIGAMGIPSARLGS
jgi:hypothetical protein